MAKLHLFIIITLAVISTFMEEIAAHGMMLDPPNRSSLWRFDSSAPVNYNDNQNFCGGFGIQWYENDGKCGPCGDNYADAQPRDNENAGTYGEGKVVAQYLAGSVINVTILLTANHKGYFNYSLCVLQNYSAPEPEDCFEDIPLADSTYNYPVDSLVNNYVNSVQLPVNITCERCVLRWNWYTGNSWGNCEDGTSGLGCGAQEMFRSCSDIRIVNSEDDYDYDLLSDPFDNFNLSLNSINLD